MEWEGDRGQNRFAGAKFLALLLVRNKERPRERAFLHIGAPSFFAFGCFDDSAQKGRCQDQESAF